MEQGPKTTAAAVDGEDIDIGSRERIRRLADVHGDGWEQLGCADPRPDYTSGGTLSNDLWLEAVKFAV
ncbi:hypothetical protein [Streptomyces sp. NPDC047000]|uniref:hypothetical protein n=1 Tax=Streptomyces sp. NPDC047000 TaxID=3155474 RepID=UPI0033EEAD54